MVREYHGAQFKIEPAAKKIGLKKGRPTTVDGVRQASLPEFAHELPTPLGVGSGRVAGAGRYASDRVVFSGLQDRVLSTICAHARGAAATTLAEATGLEPAVLTTVLDSLQNAGAIHLRSGVYVWGGR